MSVSMTVEDFKRTFLEEITSLLEANSEDFASTIVGCVEKYQERRKTSDFDEYERDDLNDFIKETCKKFTKAALASEVKLLLKSKTDTDLATSLVECLHKYVTCWQSKGFISIYTKNDFINEQVLNLTSIILTDDIREYIVIRHAHGYTTAKAVDELIEENSLISSVISIEGLKVDEFRAFLIHRLSYLKPGSARFPTKKYGEIWDRTREAYKHAIQDMPLTTTVEQVTALGQSAQRLMNEIDECNSYHTKDLVSLTNALAKTVETIHKVTPQEVSPFDHLSPQMIVVLEQISVEIEKQQVLPDNVDAITLAALLEGIAVQLKSHQEQKAISANEADAEAVGSVVLENDG